MIAFDGALAAAAAPFAGLQAALMFFDEGAFHRVRRLGEWESWGHVADSAVFAAALAPAALLAPTRAPAVLYAALALFSTILIAKDEWIHARECGGAEQWLHALLFSLHPCVLVAVGASWARGEGLFLREALPAVVAAYSFYQWFYWVGGRRFRVETAPLVDNEFYDELGALWHEGDGHAISLLRAETPVRLDYVRAALARAGVPRGARILDVGCGGGLLANPLAGDGYRVKGIDRSAPSLAAARTRTPAGADATYAVGDALALGEPSASYDAVLMMDLLEHLDEPARAVAEAAKALKPGGVLVFHTFNRTPEAWLLAVKGIGFVTREGPSNVHSLSMFITPAELVEAGRKCGLERADLTGIRPRLNLAFLSSLLHRRVHPDFSFTLTRSTRIGYVGYFSKPLVLLLLLAVPGRAAELKRRLSIGPEEIRTEDTRALAELLVGRIHRECDVPDAPASGAKVLGDDPALIMMIPADRFDAIARDGFLNQHQTRTTGGQHRESDRFEAEQELAMLRLPFDAKGLELLPKYAVLDAKIGGLGHYRLPTQYGGVAVFFKRSVAARATWTYADSLDYSQKAGRFDAGGAANPVLARTILYERKKGDANRCGNYCEAQIWGKLTLDDVEFAMVRGSEPIPAVFALAGIPVYDYSVPDSTTEVVDAGRTAQYVRGALRRAATSGRGWAPPKAAPVDVEFALGAEQARALVLYGLSELPWREFKPLLLDALDAAPGPLLISAVAFAADHQDDADVSAKLARLRRAPPSVATEWVERLTRARLCAKW